MNRLWCHGARARNDQLWASADQRSRSHETEDRLKAWWRHHYQPWGRAVFCLFLVNCRQNLAYTYEMYIIGSLFCLYKIKHEGKLENPTQRKGSRMLPLPGLQVSCDFDLWSPDPQSRSFHPPICNTVGSFGVKNHVHNSGNAWMEGWMNGHVENNMPLASLEQRRRFRHATLRLRSTIRRHHPAEA